MKKIICALSFVFLLAFIAGCENSDKKTSDEKTTTKIITTNSNTTRLTTTNATTTKDNREYHKVTYSNISTNSTMKVYYLDDEFNEYPITSGNEYPADFDGVSCTVKNTDTTKSILFAIFTGSLLDDVYEVKPGETKNIYHRQLNDDMNLLVEEFKSYSINYTQITDTTVKVYDYSDTFNPKEIPSGTKVLKYSNIYPVVENNKDERISINVKTQYNTFIKALDTDNEYSFDAIRVLDDIEIEAVALTGNNLTINIDSKYGDSIYFSSYCIDSYDDFLLVEDGEIFPSGCKASFTVYNDTDSSVTVDVTFNGNKKSYSVPVNDYGFVIDDSIYPTTDILVEIK